MMKTDGMTEAEVLARHAEKMAAKKAAREKILATKTVEKGLLIVHTGKGKGKSTAAFGMVMRAIGHGFRVAVVQFVKGRWDSGERAVLDAYPDQVDCFVAGEGFTWETQDLQRDLASARTGFDSAKRVIQDPTYRLVVLDELNIILRYGYLDVAEVLEVLTARPPGQHIIVTGRNAKDELIEAADLVTEMTMLKHPFRSGVKAQAGIEF